MSACPDRMLGGGLRGNDGCARRFRGRIILKVGITIHRDGVRSFERLHVRAHVDLEEFAVDLEESLRVGQAGELRKIVRLDLGKPRRADLRHARGFVERKFSRDSRFLKFLTETFDRHWGNPELNGGVKIDQNLSRLCAFAGTQNTALLENINDPRGAGITKAQAALQQ